MSATVTSSLDWKRRATAVLAAGLLLAATPALADDANPDPWNSLNRGVFRFNDALDRYALEPVARGYDFVMPERAQGWIGNFTSNLWFPVVFLNCVLQAKPAEATQSLARFMVNTTIGIAGFGDPATYLKVPRPNEDFGQTLGFWGVHPGPYVVIPFLGPSNVRDTFGRVADSAARIYPYFVPWWATTGEGALEVVNTRARYLEEIDDLRTSSVDYYAAVRDAYLQRRQALVEDRVGSDGERKRSVSEDDLYFPGETESESR